MIDLHCHTLFSDGELIPSELVQRAEIMGHKAIALTDHVDMSNLDFVLPRLLKAAEDLNRFHRTKVLAGAELTHVPPDLIPELIAQARRMGAQLVVVHGETLSEPVEPGTNLAAIRGGADILAHPGLLLPEEARLAAEKGVMLEISARKGHCLANGHVAGLGLQTGAELVVNTDTHAPGDLINKDQARKVALGAGLDQKQADQVYRNSLDFLEKALQRADR